MSSIPNSSVEVTLNKVGSSLEATRDIEKEEKS